jgi:hemolysin D
MGMIQPNQTIGANGSKNSPCILTSIRILIVDDQLTARSLCEGYFEPEADLDVVGSVETGQRALDIIPDLLPDIALVDIEMPGIDGLTTTRLIRDRYPHIQVLILSSHDDENYLHRALKAGAKGYLLKHTPAEEIVHAVRYVQRGYLQLGPGLFEKLAMSNVASEIQPLIHKLAPTDVTAESAKHLTTVESVSSIAPFWSNPTQELMDALPQVWSRGLLYMLGLITAILVPWAMFANVDETGTARGRLEPKGATVNIDAALAGTVAVVQAKEGQTVQKGQILVELESDLLRSDLQHARVKLEGEQNRLAPLVQIKAQLIASLNTQQLQNQAQALEKQAQVDQGQQALKSAQQSAPLQDSEKLLQVAQAQQKLEAAYKAMFLANSRLQKDEEEVERYRQAEQEGIVSPTRVVEAERIVYDSRRQKEESEANVAQAQKQLQEQQRSYQRLQQQLQSDTKQAKSRLREVLNNQNSLRQVGQLALLNAQRQIDELQSQIKALESEIKQSQAQVQALQLQLQQRTVRSPANGTLFQMPVRTPNVYLQPGQLVAQLAPQGSPLILRAQMPSQNSGFLRLGMPVKLKFDAYSFQDYGIVQGHLTKISPDSKIVQRGSEQTEVFELEVTLDSTEIQSRGRRIPLTPGQTATAEVIIRQRRIIDFLLDPFKQLQQDGLKL